MDAFELSKEQIKAINYSQAGAYAIKGIAGSGKTTVGLHRIPFLLERCARGELILVVTYHKVLVDYIEHLLNKEVFGQGKTNAKERASIIDNVKSIDSLMHQKYKEFIRNNIHEPRYGNLPQKVSDERDSRRVFHQELNKIRSIYSNLGMLKRLDAKFLQEEVDYINSCRITEPKEYQIFTRLGRNRYEDQHKNLPKKSQIREAIFQLRKNYNSAMVKAGLVDFPLMRLFAVTEVDRNPPRRYTHLIVDECQDMDRTRMDFLKYFLEDTPNASATFLYDVTQSIYTESWLGSGQSFNSLGIDIKGRSKILKKNYRTTYEIQEAAQSLLKRSEYITQEIEPTLINRSGTRPYWAHRESFDQQADYICDVIKSHSEHFELKDIIVAVRTKKEVYEINRTLNKKGIRSGVLSSHDNSLRKNQVRVMTIHSSKGLESEVMIIPNLNQGAFPLLDGNRQQVSQEIKLLYVGMTRASKHLYLTSFGTPSRFLKMIDPATLYKVDTDNYGEYKAVEDPIIDKMRNVNDRLIAVLESIPKQLSNVQTKEEYDRELENMIKTQHQLSAIDDELEVLRSEILSNTVAHDIFSNLYNIAEEKKNTFQMMLYSLIHKPIDFNEKINFIKGRFPRFDDTSIKSIASVEYQLNISELRKDVTSKDWGALMTSYSKALEIELKRVFDANNIRHENKETKKLTLSEMLHLLQNQEFPFSYIEELLAEMKFRRKRNAATHFATLDRNDLLGIQQGLMREEGVFDRINELLD